MCLIFGEITIKVDKCCHGRRKDVFLLDFGFKISDKEANFIFCLICILEGHAMMEEKHISRVKRLYSQLIAQLDADFVEECRRLEGFTMWWCDLPLSMCWLSNSLSDHADGKIQKCISLS